MKRDLYLISEAYSQKGSKPAVKKNRIPNEYVLFFGIYSRRFSNRYAEGKLIKYSDLTEHEKGLIKMMDRYATPGDFKGYEMKVREYSKYTAFVAFVGSEEAIRDIVRSYQRDYGSDFDFDERKPIPMKKETKKHFGDVFAGLKESKEEKNPDLYALILHLNRKDNLKDYYFLKKLGDLNEQEKEILKSEEGRTTSFKPGIHKFREYYPGKPNVWVDKNFSGKRILMYVAPKNILEKELEYYKLAYGKNLESGVTVRPKTKEHFGEILGGLNESKQEERYILLLKIYYPRGEETPYADYKHTRLQGLNKLDRAFLKALTPNSNAAYRHGTYEDDKEMLIRMGNHIGQYSKIIAIIGPKSRVNEEFLFFKKNIYGTRMKEEEYIKPETKEHFGNILKGLNEGRVDLIPLDIEIINVEVDETGWVGDVREITYTIRLNVQKYKDAFVDIKVVEFEHKKGEEKTNYSFKDIDDFKNMGSYEDAYRTGFKWYNSDYREIVKAIEKEKGIRELKPKTREHFGDIIRGLQESKQKNDYVLIQHFKFDRNGIYESGKYQLKPAKDLTKEEIDSLQKLERMHSYMDGYRGFDIDGYDEHNIIFGTREYLEDEIKETKKYMMGDSFKEDIPMKPKTRESFSDIFDKLNESKTKEPLWVLIIKFNKLKTSKYNKEFKYIISPLSDLPRKYKEIYDRATDWIHPAYNRKVEINTGPHVGGVDVGSYKAEVFRGSEKVIKGELESHSRVYNMVREVPVPMKDKTEKHFGDIL